MDALTTKEAAARLGIHWRSVVKAIQRGALPARKHGRDYLIDGADVEQYRVSRSRKHTDNHTVTPEQDETEEPRAGDSAS